MNYSIKETLQFLAIMACFAFGAIMAPIEAQSKEITKSIPVKGKTSDGKYPIYQLEGDLSDLTYSSPGLVWQPNDLLTRMVYIDPSDVGKYKCEWICKDSFDNVVGLNPTIKKPTRK